MRFRITFHWPIRIKRVGPICSVCGWEADPGDTITECSRFQEEQYGITDDGYPAVHEAGKRESA